MTAFAIVLTEICCEFKTVTVVALVTSTSRKNTISCQEIFEEVEDLAPEIQLLKAVRSI